MYNELVKTAIRYDFNNINSLSDTISILESPEKIATKFYNSGLYDGAKIRQQYLIIYLK